MERSMKMRTVKSTKEICRSRRYQNQKGMEMVQVALLVSIAIGLALIFRSQITAFVDGIFSKLMSSGF